MRQLYGDRACVGFQGCTMPRASLNEKALHSNEPLVDFHAKNLIMDQRTLGLQRNLN